MGLIINRRDWCCYMERQRLGGVSGGGGNIPLHLEIEDGGGGKKGMRNHKKVLRKGAKEHKGTIRRLHLRDPKERDDSP